MCFSEGDSKLQSQRASRRQTQTRRRFTDTPAAWVKFHMREENKEAGEEIISLNTDRKIRGRGLVLKSCALYAAFSHATAFGEMSALDWTNTSSDISYQGVKLIDSSGKQLHKRCTCWIYSMPQRSIHDKSAAMIKDFENTQSRSTAPRYHLRKSLIYLWLFICRTSVVGRGCAGSWYKVKNKSKKWPREIITSFGFRGKREIHRRIPRLEILLKGLFCN